MKRLLAILVMVAFVGSVAGLSYAADKGRKGDDTPPPPIKGTVVKVGEKDMTFKTTVEGKDIQKTVKPGEKTVITLDGKTAKLSDLKPDMPVSVTIKGEKVSKIEATTPVPATAPGAAVAPK